MKIIPKVQYYNSQNKLGLSWAKLKFSLSENLVNSKLSSKLYLLGCVGVVRDVRRGVPYNDQFFSNLGLLIILSSCFFPGWFFKKS